MMPEMHPIVTTEEFVIVSVILLNIFVFPEMNFEVKKMRKGERVEKHSTHLKWHKSSQNSCCLFLLLVHIRHISIRKQIQTVLYLHIHCNVAPRSSVNLIFLIRFINLDFYHNNNNNKEKRNIRLGFSKFLTLFSK